MSVIQFPKPKRRRSTIAPVEARGIQVLSFPSNDASPQKPPYYQRALEMLVELAKEWGVSRVDLDAALAAAGLN